jgi:hypothetical protein
MMSVYTSPLVLVASFSAFYYFSVVGGYSFLNILEEYSNLRI